MIYTVTFNPALDYIIRLDKLLIGETNRVSYEQALGGGKGINVSIVLKNMGIDNTALGFCAGFTGGEIIRQLNEHNCRHDFIQFLNGWNPLLQALPSKSAQFAFSYIQPASVFGSEMNLKSLRQFSGFMCRKGFVKRTQGMCIEVIADKHYFFNVRKIFLKK